MYGARLKTANVLLFLILAVYACVRTLEIAAGVPRTAIVALEVLSALAFAVEDGSRRYGWRGILVFALIGSVIGTAVENIGLATGFPFGRYQFLELMGPTLFNVPMLIGLGYVGMAYVSWVVACLILGADRCVVSGSRLFGLSFLASCIMVSWDWAQDPVWSTLLHAWQWRDGGPWFGVPLSNYFGWFLTVFLIYLAFGLYLRRWSAGSLLPRPDESWPAVVFYGLCASGNALQVLTRLHQQTVTDATGKSWAVAGILRASALVSIFVMGGFVLTAARRVRSNELRTSN